MFRKTQKETQMDLFYSPSNLLGRRASTKFYDPKAWQNIFYKEVTSRIDESLFSVLFDSANGAPNASVCRLVAMMLLKEGYGCSDEQLFEKCEFDLLARKALGLDGFEEDIPCAATYYNFRAALLDYQEKEGVDLLQKCFEQVTGSQVKAYGVSGKSVRMDSKLIGSNIALYSRYVLVHKTMCKYLKNTDLQRFDEDRRSRMEGYLSEDAAKTVYRSTPELMKTKLQVLGEDVYAMLQFAPELPLLKRVFDEQFFVENGVVIVRPKKEIPADSLQNPNDPDATYRNKNEKPVQGYTTNITETCGEKGKPSLITGVHVETATFADCNFLQDDIAQSERVTGDKVEKCHADGAYQSPDNREFAKSHFLEEGENVEDMDAGHKVMELMTGKMQGGSRFDLYLEGEELTVIDKQTCETHKAVKSKAENYKGTIPMKRWRIPWQPNKGRPWRYFTEKDIKASELRRQIESLSAEDQRMRNNIEAAMFQYSFHTRNNKTRYRGLAKHRMHAYARSMWMNFRRLAIFHSLSENHLFCAFCGLIWTFLTHPNLLFKKLSLKITSHHRSAMRFVFEGYYKQTLLNATF